MATVGHELQYLAARIGMALAYPLSRSTADALGVRLGRMAYRLMSSRRQLAFDNIKQAMGSDLDDLQVEKVVKSVFENVGRTVVELARFNKIGAEGIHALADASGMDPVRAALEKGKGAIVASAHFGNWEMMGVYPATCGIPTDMVVLTQHNAAINRLIVGLREGIGVRILEVPAQTRRVFRALKDNRLVIMAADQHSAAGSLVMDFFGRPAAVFRGPALFAARCGSPIIPMLLRREALDRHVLVVGDAIYPLTGADEEVDVRRMTAQYVAFLEKHIRAWPDQWLWTHNRWKLHPVESNPPEFVP
jgi:KDO2-lipid IV(A) lauroyltransferase